MPQVTVTALTVDRRQDVLALDQLAFASGLDDPTAEATVATATAALEWDRVFGATLDDDPDLAGIYAVYSLGLAVPGATGAAITAMAGLSWVGVDPGRRRRGVARAMLRHHLYDLHESGGESVSGLHASEPGIYGRFGYGLAASGLRLTVPRGAALRDVPGAGEVATSVVTADPAQHTDLIARLHEQACRQRPGMVSRSPLLRERHLLDPAERREHREALRLVLADRGDETTGYAVLRRTRTWPDVRPQGTAVVEEIVAADAATARALWGLLLDLDLMHTISTPSIAADDPLLRLLVDVRSARAMLTDDLWLRLVDVDRSLGARTYAQPVDVVLAVTDALCPWNARNWRLSGGPDGATCAPTSDATEVGIEVRDLASAFLGGTTVASLGAAGLAVEHRAGALAHLSAAMRSGLEPSSPYSF